MRTNSNYYKEYTLLSKDAFGCMTKNAYLYYSPSTKQHKTNEILRFSHQLWRKGIQHLEYKRLGLIKKLNIHDDIFFFAPKLNNTSIPLDENVYTLF